MQITAQTCDETADTAAYLDGELDARAQVEFERHVKVCEACAANLAAQRRVLCAMSLFVEHERGLPLPKDFARIVTAHAHTDMRGARGRGERRLALRWTLLLGGTCVLLLAQSAIFSTWELTTAKDAARNSFKIFNSVVGFAWHGVQDACAGVLLLLRGVDNFALGRVSSGATSLLCVLFLISVVMLLWLVRDYHAINFSDGKRFR